MPVQTHDILAHLGVTSGPPTLDLLNAILAAWSRRIPWESASRIARHQFPGDPEVYARSPREFFRDALALGTGGTCFESNMALRGLLTWLEFEVNPVFCDMEDSIPDPHCALLVRLGGQRYVADVGYPIPAPLIIDRKQSSTVDVPVYRYTAIPQGDGKRWEIRRQSGEVEQQSFVLKADRIDEQTFWARLVHDHEPDGLFLDQVIVQKYVDDAMLRYSDFKGLVRRTPGVEESIPLSPHEQADLPGALARLFDMNRIVLEIALSRTASASVPGWTELG